MAEPTTKLRLEPSCRTCGKHIVRRVVEVRDTYTALMSETECRSLTTYAAVYCSRSCLAADQTAALPSRDEIVERWSNGGYAPNDANVNEPEPEYEALLDAVAQADSEAVLDLDERRKRADAVLELFRSRLGVTS